MHVHVVMVVSGGSYLAWGFKVIYVNPRAKRVS